MQKIDNPGGLLWVGGLSIAENISIITLIVWTSRR